MVNDEELSKKKREELAVRIGRTKTGYDWVRRVQQIGKGDDSIDQLQEEDRSDREEDQSEG